MNPFLTDLHRLLRAPATWLVIGMLVVVPGIIVVSAPVTILRQSYSSNFAVTVTYTRQYDFSVFVYDGTGSPIAGALVNVTLTALNSTGSPNGTVVGLTSASGLVTLGLDLPQGFYQYQYSEQSPHSYVGIGGTLGPLSGNSIMPGPGVIATVSIGDFTVAPYVLVALPTPAGGSIPGVHLAYDTVGVADGRGAQILSGNLGPVTSVPQLFRFTPPPGLEGDPPVRFQLLNSSGSSLVNVSLPLDSIIPTYGNEQEAGQSLSTWLQAMEFLTLAAGAFLGYLAYGHDRVSGALEPVVALPLSRMKVVWMRFASAAAILAVGTAASVFFLFGWLLYELNITTPAIVVASTWAGLVLASLSLLAITFLLARLSQSHVTVLGGALALTAVFSLLWWDLVAVIASVLGIPSSGTSTMDWKGMMSLISPGMAVTNPVSWGLSVAFPYGSQIFPVAPSAPAGAAAIVLWIVLPFLALTWCVRHLD